MLVEVLAAILLVGMFVAVVLPFVGQLAAHWNAGQSNLARTEVWMQALARMEADLSQAAPVKMKVGGLAFRLRERSVQFASLSSAKGDVELALIRFDIQSTPNGQVVVRHVGSFDGASEAFESVVAGNSTILLDGFSHAAFAAIGKDGKRQTDVSGVDRLPGAVELSLWRQSGGGEAQQRLIFPVAAGRLF